MSHNPSLEDNYDGGHQIIGFSFVTMLPTVLASPVSAQQKMSPIKGRFIKKTAAPTAPATKTP